MKFNKHNFHISTNPINVCAVCMYTLLTAVYNNSTQHERFFTDTQAKA